MSKVHLRLPPGRCLETHLKGCRSGRADLAQQIRQDRVATRVAKIAQFAMQPPSAQVREGGQALAQIRFERLQLRDPRLARPIRRDSRPCAIARRTVLRSPFVRYAG